jgi:hypothetical protein
MRMTSGRIATAATLLIGLAALAVAGRLLPSAPSTQDPAATATTGAATAPVIRTAPGNTRGYAVPDALGRTLAQAERVMRVGGLRGSAIERDPQGPNAVVVAQEPPAGVLVPPGSVVGFQTRTGVQPYGAPRWLRLGRGPTSAAYRIVTPDPATHQLVVAVVAPPAADVQVWLEPGPGRACRCWAAPTIRGGVSPATNGSAAGSASASRRRGCGRPASPSARPCRPPSRSWSPSRPCDAARTWRCPSGCRWALARRQRPGSGSSGRPRGWLGQPRGQRSALHDLRLPDGRTGPPPAGSAPTALSGLPTGRPDPSIALLRGS